MDKHAAAVPVWFGTYTNATTQSQGIYVARFDTATGSLTTPVLAVSAKQWARWAPGAPDPGRTTYAPKVFNDGIAAWLAPVLLQRYARDSGTAVATTAIAAATIAPAARAIEIETRAVRLSAGSLDTERVRDGSGVSS